MLIGKIRYAVIAYRNSLYQFSSIKAVGRNPRTGEQIQIAASQKVKFLPAKALKEVFNR